jgi:hypothetical protein
MIFTAIHKLPHSPLMKCPHCQKEINVGALIGSVKSEAKTRAARENAKKGGWPKGKKRGPRAK